ncbi:hypothetical protein MMC24_005598 [Lignoscripta atroalba]|nr:hypothetical protein [Lignoscripta atroalba]
MAVHGTWPVPPVENARSVAMESNHVAEGASGLKRIAATSGQPHRARSIWYHRWKVLKNGYAEKTLATQQPATLPPYSPFPSDTIDEEQTNLWPQSLRVSSDLSSSSLSNQYQLPSQGVADYNMQMLPVGITTPALEAAIPWAGEYTRMDAPVLDTPSSLPENDFFYNPPSVLSRKGVKERARAISISAPSSSRNSRPSISTRLRQEQRTHTWPTPVTRCTSPAKTIESLSPVCDKNTSLPLNVMNDL